MFSITSNQVLPITASYLVGRFQSESIQNAIQNTGHEARVLSIYLITKMLLGKTKKEYFG